MERDTAFCARHAHTRNVKWGNDRVLTAPRRSSFKGKKQYATPHGITKMRMVNYNYIFVKSKCQSFAPNFTPFSVIFVGITIHTPSLLCILRI